MDWMGVLLVGFFLPPDKVPILEKKRLPVVGIGKHLCGAATGMNYRSVICTVRILNLTL